MFRTRSLTGYLLLALTSLGLVAASLAPASAAPATPIIRGLVTDASGAFLDDVMVEALDSDGTVQATALTYASEKETGPQHGFYGVEVPEGTYQLRFSKDGFVTRTYGSQVVVDQTIVNVGTVALSVPPKATRTTAALKDTSITPDDKGKVVVTVSSAATRKPVGAVEVRVGRKLLGSGQLKAGDRGQVTVTLKKLDRGSYDLKASFLGSTTLKESTSKKVTLTVKKPARHRHNRPNALAFVG